MFTAGALLAALGLAGCLSSNDDDTGKGTPPPHETPLGTYTQDVLDIDREEQKITVRDAYWWCDGEDAVHETDSYEEDYRITGGKLYRWEEGNSCLSSIVEGTSADIVGTWSGNPPALGDGPVEDAEWCDEYSRQMRESYNRTMRRLKLTENISAAKITSTLTGEFCGAENFVNTIALMTSEYTEALVEDCSLVTLVNSDEDTARIESDVTDGMLKMTFVSGEATCTANLSMTDETEPVCKDGGADAVFENCVLASGFFGQMWLEKRGAGAPRSTVASQLRGFLRSH